MYTMSVLSADVGDIEKMYRKEPSIGELLKSSQINDCLVKLIHQFLLYNEFEGTADSLVHEAPRLGFNVLGEHSCVKNAIPKESCKRILSDFRSGDWRTFFASWDNLVADNIKETMEYKVLTFKLRVHFAILPIRIVHLHQHLDKQSNESLDLQTLKILERAAEIHLQGKELENIIVESMEQLREYLAMDGQELEGQTQLLPFFKLPYLTDPYKDSSFSEIFDISWMDELTVNLQVFVMSHRQIQHALSQKTSTETLISRSDKLCNTPLTEDSSKNFDQNKLNGLSSIQIDSSPIPLEIAKSTILDSVPLDIVENNIRIVPNDRNIPIFSEDDEIEEQLSFYRKRSNSIHSKSAQTRISGIKTTINCLQTSDLNQPTSIVNSNAFARSPKSSIQTNQELILTKSHLYNIHYSYQKLKLRFHKLHADYHKLIGIAGELTVALENSVRGQAVDLQSMLESCIKIFPDLFNQNVRDNSEITSVTKSEEEIQQIDLATVTHSVLDISSLSPKLLDFKKIKLHLISGNVKTKLLLLQALRWKITLSQPSERDETIHEYIKGDLLGLHGQIASDGGKPILPYLLMPMDVGMPHPLQQSAARLANAIASLRCGRDYLAVGCTVLNVAMKCLNGNNDESIDAFTCDMIIAMLQKLSLRKQQRIYMIECDLTEWLIYHLKTESHRIGSYRLEYATALLMNLSLHRQAQVKAASIASLVISTLTTLLSTDHTPALSYINGALNNFLSNHEINEEAKITGLASVLEYHRKQNTGEIRKHLDHILKVHRRDYTDDIKDEETADDDNEELDILEDELEEGDPVKVHSGELVGEALLTSCYSIVSNIMQSGSLVANTSGLKTPKLHSRPVSVKSLQHKQRSHDKNASDDQQLPTHDRGLSPRLTPVNCKLRKRNMVHLQPIQSFSVRTDQSRTTSLSITKLLSADGKEQQVLGQLTIQEYPSLTEIGSSATYIQSKTSFVAKVDSELDIKSDSEKSAATFTSSPYFFSYTKMWQPKVNSDNSVQPTLNSDTTNVASRDASLVESEESTVVEMKNRKVRSERRERLRMSPDLSEMDCQAKVKSIQLGYSEETNSNEIAVYLYANRSSKDSSKTTITSAASTLASTGDNAAMDRDELSSIASLNPIDKSNEPIDSNSTCLEKEEEAFLAKPKISRTPPETAHSHSRSSSTRSEVNSRPICAKQSTNAIT